MAENPSDFPPPSSLLRVAFGAHSRRSRRQAVNEDHYLVVEIGRYQSVLMTSLPDESIQKRFDESAYGMVVADGIGLAGGGEPASRLALETLMHLTLQFGKWNLRINAPIAEEVMDRAVRFVRRVDSALVVGSEQSGGASRLRSTLTAVWGAGRDLFFCHVGHSRAYLLREGRLIQLTRDHTLRWKEANGAPARPLMDVSHSASDLTHVITETVGMSGLVEPQIDIERFRVRDNDVVLLCTNGLTDVVDETAIADVLASGRSPNEISARLVELAESSEDDVTAVVARYQLPE